MDLFNILEKAKSVNASDVHITVGLPPMLRSREGLTPAFDEKLISDDVYEYIDSLLKPEHKKVFEEKGEVDFSFGGAAIGRYRANVFMQSGNPAMALRLLASEPYTLSQLKLPDILTELAEKRRGLILVTGPTGSGKSTTLAAMIDHINSRHKQHIITVEDPIEYVHKHKNSIINQREVGSDTESFGNALRAALRQDPDIILVGEMRDLETIQTAIRAAETGHLVLSTLHTTGAAKTIDRIIDVFPPHQQQQVRTQLATVLQAVISQQIMPSADRSERVVGLEIMINTPAVSNLIREGKTHQINTVIQTGKQHGMILMDKNLMELYQKGKIDKETLNSYAIDKNLVAENML